MASVRTILVLLSLLGLAHCHPGHSKGMKGMSKPMKRIMKKMKMCHAQFHDDKEEMDMIFMDCVDQLGHTDKVKEVQETYMMMHKVDMMLENKKMMMKVALGLVMGEEGMFPGAMGEGMPPRGMMGEVMHSGMDGDMESGSMYDMDSEEMDGEMDGDMIMIEEEMGERREDGYDMSKKKSKHEAMMMMMLSMKYPEVCKETKICMAKATGLANDVDGEAVFDVDAFKEQMLEKVMGTPMEGNTIIGLDDETGCDATDLESFQVVKYMKCLEFACATGFLPPIIMNRK